MNGGDIVTSIPAPPQRGRDEGEYVQVTGNPRRLNKAVTSGSRPRKARYATLRSVSLPVDSRVVRKRSAVFLSQTSPVSTKAAQVSASIVSDQR